MAVAKWKEAVKLSVTSNESKRLLYFKQTNKNFPWTTVHWQRVTEISISCFYGRQVEQRMGETVRKFAKLSLPTPDCFFRYRYTLPGHPAAKVKDWLGQTGTILAVTIAWMSIDCINQEFSIPGYSRKQFVIAALSRLLWKAIKNGYLNNGTSVRCIPSGFL